MAFAYRKIINSQLCLLQGPQRLDDLSVSAWRPRPSSRLSVRYVRTVPTLQQPESAGLELSASVSSRFTSLLHMKEKHENMQIRWAADSEILHGPLEPITFRLSGAELGGGLAQRTEPECRAAGTGTNRWDTRWVTRPPSPTSIY